MKRRTFITQASAALAAVSLQRLPASSAAESREFDLIVYGGVPCGIAAAVMAAREGAKVLLVEPMKHVGGLSTSGVNTAETEHMLKWTIGGFADEFYRRLGKEYGTGVAEYYFESSVAEKVYLDLLREAGVEVRYGASVEKVRKDGGRIAGLVLTDGSQLGAKVFIDASYEGDLMARAGVKYAVGRESKADFGEELAGIRFDKIPRKARTVDDDGKLLAGISGWARDLKEGDAHRGVMNYNFRLCFAKEADKRVAIPMPAGYERARYAVLGNWFGEKANRGEAVKLTDVLDLYGRRHGKFEVNNKTDAIISLGHFGGQFDWPNGDYAVRAKIFDDHKAYTLGLLHFLGTDESAPENVRSEMRGWGLHKEEFTDNGNFPYQLYVREARRMRGQYVMAQKDVQDDRRKSDTIGISSHFIDCHHVQRLAVSPTEFVNEGRIWRMGSAYQIPYRAITPKLDECTNLLVPGAGSYTHVAFCTLRLESVWMIAGHAAGVAAAMSAKQGRPVQEVALLDLQAKLRSQGQALDFVPGAPEKCERLNGPPEF